MRWARVEVAGKQSYGIVREGNIELVNGDPFDGYQATGESHALAAVRWLPPVVPPNFYAVGLNYTEHVRMEAELRGKEPVFPAQADVGYRSINALFGHGAPIVIPADATERIEYEAEIVGVVGPRGQEPYRGGCAVVSTRLHHWQRCQRADLAEI